MTAVSHPSTPSRTGPPPAPVTFLTFDAWGGGGVARTTANLANELARTGDVRMISMRRRREDPRFPLDPSIPVTTLMDERPGTPRWHRALNRVPSRLRPQPSERTMSLRTDVLLRRAIRDVHEGVLVSTRPSLHLALTAWARPGVATVGWDHLNFPARWRNDQQRSVLQAVVPRLDAYVVLTDADAADYHQALPDLRTEVRVIRNSVSWPLAEQPPDPDSTVIVAAGRLVPRKGLLRLVRSFAPVGHAHPDWQLHLYGNGEDEAAIRALVDKRRLGSQVILKGYTEDLPQAFAGAAIYAMGSKSEGFPMVLIEAMSIGLPLVAFDCPRGPGETIDHGRNGLLVADGDRRGYSRALTRLVEDRELRRRLGAQARVDAERYVVANIAAEWQTLFATLAARQATRATAP